MSGIPGLPATASAGGADEPALPQPLPLFPLRTVLFPEGLLQLKIFEARYLDMVSERLRTRTPFGVVCLRDGTEARSKAPVLLERVGTLARIDEVDSEQAGILRLVCRGTRRFRLLAQASQQADGLWTAPVELLPEPEGPLAPDPAHKACVDALAQAIVNLAAQDVHPFGEPHRLDDAGWVADRWCELLPIPLAARQKLLELDDAPARLRIVDEYLRGKGVLR